MKRGPSPSPSLMRRRWVVPRLSAERLKALQAGLKKRLAEESALKRVSAEELLEEPPEASNPAQNRR